MNRDLIPRVSRRIVVDSARLACGLALLACSGFLPAARAQFDRASGTVISGVVFADTGNQPLARVRVDVRSLTGAQVATAYTDSEGRFETRGPKEKAGSYIVSVAEPGYQRIEERVDETTGGSSVVLTLRKAPASAEGHAAPSPENYTVSVRDLQVPGKARKAFEKALERLQKQDLPGSIAHFKEATDAFPNYYEAFYQLGLVNLELRRRDDAERALQKAIDLSGGHNPEPQYALGALLCDQGSFRDAEKVIRRGMETDMTSWKGHLFLGQALFGQDRLDEAEKNVRKALSLKPDLASAYVLMANIHIRERSYSDAIKELDTYLRFRPDGPASQQAREVRNAAERVLSRFSATFSVPQLFY